jgi:Cu(I)/Ag(I) efflux system membrane fusion protein
MNKLKNNKYLKYALLVIVGLLLGWVFFHSSTKTDAKKEASQQEKGTVWTCSMHPQIRKTEPGKCPICGMDLIPLKTESNVKIDPNAIQLTEDAVQLANVETSIVGNNNADKEIRLYGKVQADERLLQSQTAHVSGRIEQLNVNYEGQSVHRGQTLAVIYSPDLLTAQQELIEAAKTKSTEPEIYQAAKEKLHQWKLSDAQIKSIEKSGQVKNRIPITSNTDGVVVSKRVNTGDYINQGGTLLDVANLSRVWVLFDAYENDLTFLKKGEKLSFSIQAIPDKSFSGVISFIDPSLDPTTRTVKVRVEIANAGGLLKPGMFATALAHAGLGNKRDVLTVPASSVLWTGKRSVVYVKQPGVKEPTFQLREIELGAKLNDSYVVENGLKRGEEIVTKGTFQVDAAAQLDGKKSMMNEK